MTNTRLTGADSGICSACVGLGLRHNEYCTDKGDRSYKSVANLLSDAEVERLEEEGKDE